MLPDALACDSILDGALTAAIKWTPAGSTCDSSTPPLVHSAWSPIFLRLKMPLSMLNRCFLLLEPGNTCSLTPAVLASEGSATSCTSSCCCCSCCTSSCCGCGGGDGDVSEACRLVLFISEFSLCLTSHSLLLLEMLSVRLPSPVAACRCPGSLDVTPSRLTAARLHLLLCCRCPIMQRGKPERQHCSLKAAPTSDKSLPPR